jgi:hypothetical protein
LNRRNSLKSIGSLVLLSISSVSIYEGMRSRNEINFNRLVEKKSLIVELAETIIPKTSTPGAKDAKVDNYILRMLSSCATIREQHIFLDGLTDLEYYTLKKYNANFVNCAANNKIEILKHFEDKSNYSHPLFNKLQKKLWGKPFFVMLKEYTAQGYCNSEAGSTKGLAYDYVPSTYQACVKIADHQRSWATK